MNTWLKTLIIICFTTPVFSLLSACGGDESKPVVNCTQAGNAFYFLQPASTSEMHLEQGDLRLTLHNVGRTIWFTDRPSADAGLILTDAFLSLWDELGIASGAPGVITVDDGVMLVSSHVALSDPVWDADKQTLSYRVQELVKGKGVGMLEHGSSKATTVLIDPTVLAANCAPDLQAKLLYVQSGLSGTVIQTNAGTELRLEGVHATTYFTHEPDRAAGVVNTSTFMHDWAASPSANAKPPHAVLDMPERTDGSAMVTLELSQPRIEGTALVFLVKTPSSDQIVANASVLNAGVKAEPSAFPALPEHFTHAALFIENFESASNSMIADSVTQPNVLVLAESPQISMGSLYQTISQGIALAMENALQQQGDLNIVYQASTNVGVQTLYGVDVSSTGVSHTAERFWD